MTKWLTLNVHAGVAARIRAVANHKGIAVSTLIARAFECYVERYGIDDRQKYGERYRRKFGGQPALKGKP